MRLSRLAAALLIAVAAMATPGAASASYCKTLTGAFVGFGEETTRGDAQTALDREIAAWEKRSGLKAKPKKRKVECKVYIGWLNEFECTAVAEVCR